MYLVSLTNENMTEWIYTFVNSLGEATQVYPDYYVFYFGPVNENDIPSA